MGSICKSNKKDQEDDIKIDTIIIKEGDSAFSKTSFSFTKEKLIFLESDVLVMFDDKYINLLKSEHFKQMQVQAVKLQEHVDAKIAKDKIDMKQQDLLIVNFIIPTLKFKSLMVCTFQNWTQQNKHSESEKLEEVLDKMFLKLEKEEAKSIVVTQFSPQLGIPIQTGIKAFVRKLKKLKNPIKSVQFCCLTNDSKNTFMNAVTEYTSEFSKTDDESIAESDYY